MAYEFKDYLGGHMSFDSFPKFGVLSSVNVLMTGTNIAGPFAAAMMAEMGAKVIQVEAPNMPCQTRGNYGYHQDHRNTYSITLNTRNPKGKEVLEKLVAWADIWIESGRPGTYAKNGLSDDHMWEINPKLAIVHVSGYGQYGPDKDKAAYDVSGQAMGGYMYMNGVSPTSAPLKVNPFLSDYATALNACICALSILTHARAAGEGDSVDISQYETMFRLLGQYPMEWFNKGYPAKGEPVKYRTGNVSDMAAGFSFYDCKDGTIFIGMVGLGNCLSTDPDFPEGMTGSLKSLPRGIRIENAISSYCAARTVDEVEAELNALGIPNQKAFAPYDIEANEHYAAREDIVTWHDNLYGEVKGIGIMNKFSRNPAQIVGSAPLFGEHNREIMLSLGYDDAFVDEMYAKGVTAHQDARQTAIRLNLAPWGFFWRDDQIKNLEL